MARTPQQPGFSLVELLIAMGIFTIGFVTVAAIFPSAILVQKRTIEAEEAGVFASNSVKLLSQALDEATVATTYSGLINNGRTGPLDADFTSFGERDRAYLADHFDNPANADYFWLPVLGRSDTGTEWSVFALIVKRDPTITDYSNGSAEYDGDEFSNQIPRVFTGDVSTFPVSPSPTIAIAGATTNEIGVGDTLFINQQEVRVLEVDTSNNRFTLDQAVPEGVPGDEIIAWYVPRESPGRRSPLLDVASADLN